jgi:tRNA 2-thiouridine synthesizing protein E
MRLVDTNGQTIARDDDGFLTDPVSWTADVAEALAHAEGVESLTDRHWKVLALCREWFARERRRPDLHFVAILSGYGCQELIALFGKDPLTQIARIAGLPNPEGLARVDS